MESYPGAMETTEWLGDCLESAAKETSCESESDRQENLSDDAEDKVIPVKGRIGSKPHSTPMTLKWLEENYEVAERVCIPRSTLYVHYMDFCEKSDSQPVNAASFGKIIRQQFPHITTRRLGTRGQSKYHYYGVGVRESSIYYDIMFSAKGVDGGMDGKKDGMKQIVAYSPRSKLGTLLPDFPEIKDIKIPSNIDEGKVVTFLMMYRTHCQRILDTVIRANFDEVQSFLLHFWQGMPSHMVPILDCESVVMLVGVCDAILYKAVASVLMPTVLQALPESLTQVIKKFARQLDEWLKVALNNLPNNLQKIKFDLARRFGQVLKRQTSLSHLCQTARSVVQSADITAKMLDDWLSVDLNSIGKQTLYTMDQYSERDHRIIFSLCTEFEKLLEEQAPMESYIEWLDSMVDRCVVQPSFRKPGCLRRIARQFLLMWSCFGTRIIRDMTLHSAPSFGSFHLLHLMFDDYVLYLVENIYNQERSNEYLRSIRGEQMQGDVDEVILPDPAMIKQNFVQLSDTMQQLHSQERESVIISSRAAIGQIGYDANVDVTSPILNHSDKMLLESGRSCQIGSEGQGVTALYANCASFSSGYPAAQPGDKTLPHIPPVSCAYSMPTAQVYTSGSQLLDAGGRPVLAPVSMTSGGVNNGGIPQDWSHASQPRQALGGNDTAMSLSRINDPAAFQAYGAPLRQQGIDYSYMYETPPKGTGQVLTDSSPYLYHGYSTNSEYHMYGENNNKRRVDNDGASRNYKRPKTDAYYYDNMQSGFA